MVAIIGGAGLGLFNSSIATVGEGGINGNAATGRGGDRVYVNSGNGNLVVQNIDESLSAVGLDVALVRTYNSRGGFDGDNNDGWRMGVYRQLHTLTGTRNVDSSTITKTFGDGADAVYRYDTARGSYVSTDGDGAHDTLRWDEAAQQWTWTDGSSRTTEIYNASGQLIETRDTDGNRLSYVYTGTLLTRITDGSGQTTHLDYSGSNLTQIRVVSNGQTQTLTRYAYDSNNRLERVTVDLSPEDNSITDGRTYVTRYEYYDSSRRLARITQTDGTWVEFFYQLRDGDYRMHSHRTHTPEGDRSTYFYYMNYTASAGGVYQHTNVLALDPADTEGQQGLLSGWFHNAQGQLGARLLQPSETAQFETRYYYDANGSLENVVEDIHGLNRVTVLEYDANGNLTREYDPLGSSRGNDYVASERDAIAPTITRTYSSTNQILTETQYLVADPDGVGAAQPSAPLTTRYVYDSEDHLRFVVSAEGRVTEHRYNAAGQRILTLRYTDDTYAVATLAPATALTEAQMQAWAAHADRDRSKLERVDYAYDFRGELSRTTAWSTTDSAGNGTGTPSITQFVYDQRGRLLQTIDPRGSATTPNPENPNLPYATTYTYDGLGRVLTTIEWVAAGQPPRTTTTQYDDVDNRTVTTFANNLVTTSTYNRFGELTRIVSGAPGMVEQSTSYQYDIHGRLRITTDPTGIRAFNVYDEAGRKIGEIDGDGSLTEYVYNRVHELVKTVRYATALTSAALATLTDAAGNPVDVRSLAAIRPAESADDQITRAVYNDAGQLVYAIDASGAVTETRYDGAGRVTDVLRYVARVTIARSIDELSTDTFAPVASAHIPPGTNPESIADECDRLERYVYDNDGNLCATIRDAGRYLWGGYVVEYFYDAASRLIETLVYANPTGANLNIEGTLDDLRPPLREQTSDGSLTDARTRYFYDSQGREIGVLDAEGYLTETGYDTTGQVREITRYDVPLVYTAGATVDSLKSAIVTDHGRHRVSYEYDGVGRRVRETETQGTASVAASVVTTYVYDAADNLVRRTRALDTSEARTTEAKYDALGRALWELSSRGSDALALLSNPTQADIDRIWRRYGVRHEYDAAGRRIASTTVAYDPIANTEQTLTTWLYHDVDGRVRFTLNTVGEVTENRYNTLGQLTDILAYTNRLASLPTQRGGLLQGDLASQLTPMPDPARDARRSYAYAPTGQVVRTATALNEIDRSVTTHDYNAFGEEHMRIASIDVARTRRSEFVHDAGGVRFLTRIDTGGFDLRTIRNSTARTDPDEITDARGYKNAFKFDRLNRLTLTIDALNGRRTASYDAFNRVLSTRDALYSATYNTTTTYTYNDTTRSVVVRTPEGVQATTVANRFGQTLTVTANGNTTTYQYDDDGQVTRISDNLGTLESRTYDSAGRLLTETDVRGVVTRFSYDAAGRLFTRIVDDGGLALTTTYRYDGQGRVIEVTEPNARVTRTEYDAAGRVVEIAVDPAGANLRTRYTYDLEGNLLTITEGYGSTSPRVTEYRYDTVGRRTHEILDPGGLDLTTQYKYDNNGNVTRTIDANGASTWFIYNENNWLTYTVDALGKVSRRSYDIEGRVVATRDYHNIVDTGGFGDIVASISVTNSAADVLTQTVYDKDGRAIYTIDGVGDVVEFAYNANGQVTRSRHYANAIAVGAYTGIEQVQSALTAAGNNLTVIGANDQLAFSVYDERGRAVFSIDGMGRTVQSHYDGNGNVIQTTAFATARTVRNANGTLAVQDLAALLSFATANAGNSQNQITRFAYDKAGRLRSSTVTSNGINVRSVVLYDALNRQIAIIDGDGTLTEIVYNDLDQVVKTVRYADALTQATLDTLADASGNPLDVSLATVKAALPTLVGRASDQITRAIYDDAGQLVYSIDAGGAVTRTFYDAARRVIGTVQYATAVAIERTLDEIAPDSIEITTSDDDRRARVFYDDNGNVLATLDAAGYWAENVYNDAGELIQTIAYANPTNAADRAAGTYATLHAWALANTDTETTIDPEQDRNTYLFYDGQHRTVGSLDAEGYLTETEYNSASQVARTIRYDRKLTYVVGTSTFQVLKDAAAGAATHTHVYQYDGVGRVRQETDYEGTVTFYSYDSAGKIIGTTRAFGTTEARTEQVRYDALGRVTHELSGEGSKKLAAANLTSVQIEQIWTRYGIQYGYDAAGRRISATTVAFDSSNNTLQALVTYFYYDVDNRIRFTVRKMGDGTAEITENRYNALNQLTDTLAYSNRLNAAAAGSLTGGLLTAALIAQLTPGAGVGDASTRFTYELSGRVDTQTRKLNDAESVVTTFDYTAFGEEETRIEQIDATRTRRSEFVYDTRGRLKTTRTDITGFAIETGKTYDAFGRVTAVTDGRGNVSKFEYDRLGRTVATVDALTGRFVTTYDAFDRVLTLRDALHNETTYRYDDVTRSVVVRTPEGIEVTTVHNAHGQDLLVTAAGRQTRYEYNADGKLTRVSDNLDPSLPAGSTLESHAYDSAGRETSVTDARGAVTRFSYDAANRLLTRSLVASSVSLVTTYQYDGQGRVIQMTEPGNRITKTSYDAGGRVTEVTVDPRSIITPNDNPNGLNLRTVYTYDKEGRTLTVVQGAGSNSARTTEYRYDTLGRRTHEILDPGTGRLNLTTQYRYDRSGNVTRKIDARGYSTWYVYDAKNRQTFSINALGELSERAYDLADRVIRTSVYANRIDTSSFEDEDVIEGRIVDGRNTLQGGDGPVIEIAYNNNDRGNLFAYDRDGRLAFTQLCTVGGASAAVVQYDYDDAGRIVKETTYATPRSPATGGSYAAFKSWSEFASVATPDASLGANKITRRYYDVRGRLIYTIEGGSAVTKVENGVSVTVNGTSAVTAYRYDLNGNVIEETRFASPRPMNQSMELADVQAWASANAIVTLNQTTRFWYDAANRNRFTLDAEGFLKETRHFDAARQVRMTVYNRMNTTTIADAVIMTPATLTIAANATIEQVEKAAAVHASAAYDQVSITHFDAAGRVDYTVDGEGWRTNFVLDASGNALRVERQIDRLGPPSSSSYAVTRHYFDAANREIYTLSAENYLTVTTYNALGLVESRTIYDRPTAGQFVPVAGDTKHVTRYTYDALGRVTRETRELETYSRIGSNSYTVPSGGSTWEDIAILFYRTLDVAEELQATVGNGLPLSPGRTLANLPAKLIDVVHKDYTYDVRGNVTDVIEAAGTNEARTTHYTFDALGRLTDTTMAVGTVDAVTTHLDLDVFGNVRQRHEAHGTDDVRVFEFEYDAMNRVVTERDPLARITLTRYDALGNVRSHVRAAGTVDERVEYFTHDRRNLLITVTNAAWEKTEYAYDGAGNRIAIRNANLAGLLHDDDLTPNDGYYRDWRRRLGIVDGTGAGKAAVDLITRDVDYLTARCTIAYLYDRDNRLIQETDARGFVTQHTYSGTGNRLTTTQPEGRVTVYTYNRDGALKTVTDPMGGLTQYEYDGLGNQTKITDAGGGVRANVFDALGRLRTSTLTGTGLGNGGLRTANTYDRRGNRVSTTQSFGDGSDARTTTYRYDLLNRQTRITDGEGFSTSIVYDDFDNQTMITTGQYLASPGQPGYDADKAERADALSQSFIYDAGNRLTSTENGEGYVTHYRYNAHDNRIGIVDGNGEEYAKVTPVETEKELVRGIFTTHYKYDAADRLIGVVTPLGGQTHYTYDRGGNRVAERQLQSARENGSGQVVLGSSGNPLDAVWIEKHFEYDGIGQLTAEIDSYQTRTEHVYDAVGNVIWHHYAVGTSEARSVGLEYDKNNRKTADLEHAYDADGNPLFGEWRATRYEYDRLGNRISATDALGNTAHYYYDAGSRMTTLIDAERYVNTFAYDSAGNRTGEYIHMSRIADSVVLSDTVPPAPPSATENDRSVTLVYDRASRATSRTVSDGPGEVPRSSRTEYRYNGSGKVLRETLSAETSVPRVLMYTYDLAGRLHTFTDVDNTLTTYTYDASNNRLSETITSSNDVNGVRHTQYTYDFNNRRITETFDPNGLNLRQAFAYDQAGNLVSTRTNAAIEGGTLTVEQVSRFERITRFAYDLNNREIRREEGVTNLAPLVADPADASRLLGVIGGLAIQPIVTQYRYDRVGNRTHVVSPNGNTPGFLGAEPSSEAHTTTFVYDKNNRLIREEGPQVLVNPGGGSIHPTTIHVYDAAGRLVQITDPNGYKTTRYYDGNSRVVAEIGADNVVREYDYNAAGQMIGERFYLARVETEAHRANNVATDDNRPVMRGASQMTSYWYDLAGRRTHTWFPPSSAFGLANPEANTPNVYRTSTDHFAERHVYDVYGNEVETYDRNGNRTLSYYDVKNRKVATIDALGYLTEWDYDVQDNVTAQRVFTEPYDDFSSITSSTRPAIKPQGHVHVTNRVYDAASRLILEVHPAIEVFDPTNPDDNATPVTMRPQTFYTYDKAGNLLSKTMGFGTSQAVTEAYFYDAANRRIAMIDANRVLTVYWRDPNGNVVDEYRFFAQLPPMWGDVPLDLASQDPAARATLQHILLGIINDSFTGERASGVVVDPDKLKRTSFRYDAMNRLIQETNHMDVRRRVGDAYLEYSDDNVTKGYAYDAAGNRTWMEDESGRITHVEYDGAGRVVRTLAPDGNTETLMQYDAAGNLTLAYTGRRGTLPPINIQTMLGADVTVTWDVQSELPQNTWVVWDTQSRSDIDDYANATAAQTHANARVSASFAAPGAGSRAYFRVITADTQGRRTWSAEQVVIMLGSASSPFRMVPLLNGERPGSELDTQSGGYFIENVYNAFGRKIASNEGDGLYREFDLDPNGNVLATRLYGKKDGAYGEQRGRAITTYTAYDARNRKIAEYGAPVQNEVGLTLRPVERYTYDAFDNLASRRQVTGYISGAPLTQENEFSRFTQYFYNAMNVLVAEFEATSTVVGNGTGAAHYITHHFVDQFGRETGIRTPRHSTSFSTLTRKFYDQVGRLIEVRDPLGNRTGYAYDYFGRKIAETDGRGMVGVEIGTSATGAGYYTTGYEYDQADRLVRIRQAQGWHLLNDNGAIYQEERWRLGAIRVVGPNSQVSADKAQEIIDRYTTFYSYDKRGYRTVEEDGRFMSPDEGGLPTIQSPRREYKYDAMGRVEESSVRLYNAMHATIRRYDPYGNVIEEIDPLGRRKTWYYGAFGRLERYADEQDNTADPQGALGNTTVYGYDDYGRQTSEIDIFGKNVARTYDDAGRLRSITDHATGVSTQYTYYLTGERANEFIDWPANSTPSARRLTYSYDSRGQMTRWHDSVSRYHLNIGYDADGNRTHVYTDERVNLDGVTPLAEGARFTDHVYAFDNAGRLSGMLNRSNWSKDRASYSYTYDAAGNRLTYLDGETRWSYHGGSDLGPGIDANNRVALAIGSSAVAPAQIQNWEYDGVGNVLKHSHAVSGGGSTTTLNIYTETGRPKRVGVIKSGGGGTTTNYLYDNSGRLLKLTGLDHEGLPLEHVYDYYADGREKTITIAGRPNQTVYEYNVNKQLTKIDLGRGDGMTRNEATLFVYDNEGHIVQKDHDSGRGQNPGLEGFQASDTYYYANGQPVGHSGSGAVVELDTGPYSLVKHVGADFPDSAGNMHTVRAGETLQLLASLYYGNPSLWYVIADANGLTATTPLREGATLRIPNTIKTGSITAENHAVYDESGIIGRTLPHMKTPKPKRTPHDRCVMATAIIMAVIIAVIVSYATAGVGTVAATGALSTLGGAGAAGSASATAAVVTATAFMGAALGLAGASATLAINQAISKGFYGQDYEFDGRELGIATLTGAISGGLQGLGAAMQAAATARDLSLKGARWAKFAASAINMSQEAIQQEMRYGKIKSYTGIAVAGLNGLASMSSAIDRGAQAALRSPDAFSEGIASWQRVEDFASYAHRSARSVEFISKVSRFTSPWIQLYESYERGQIKPEEEWQHWSNALASTAGEISTVAGQQLSLLDNDFVDRLAMTGISVASNLAVAGVAAARNQGTFARDHLLNSLSMEAGAFLGGVAGQGIYDLMTEGATRKEKAREEMARKARVTTQKAQMQRPPNQFELFSPMLGTGVSDNGLRSGFQLHSALLAAVHGNGYAMTSSMLDMDHADPHALQIMLEQTPGVLSAGFSYGFSERSATRTTRFAIDDETLYSKAGAVMTGDDGTYQDADGNPIILQSMPRPQPIVYPGRYQTRRGSWKPRPSEILATNIAIDLFQLMSFEGGMSEGLDPLFSSPRDMQWPTASPLYAAVDWMRDHSVAIERTAAIAGIVGSSIEIGIGGALLAGGAATSEVFGVGVLPAIAGGAMLFNGADNWQSSFLSLINGHSIDPFGLKLTKELYGGDVGATLIYSALQVAIGAGPDLAARAETMVARLSSRWSLGDPLSDVMDDALRLSSKYLPGNDFRVPLPDTYYDVSRQHVVISPKPDERRLTMGRQRLSRRLYPGETYYGQDSAGGFRRTGPRTRPESLDFIHIDSNGLSLDHDRMTALLADRLKPIGKLIITGPDIPTARWNAALHDNGFSSLKVDPLPNFYGDDLESVMGRNQLEKLFGKFEIGTAYKLPEFKELVAPDGTKLLRFGNMADDIHIRGALKDRVLSNLHINSPDWMREDLVRRFVARIGKESPVNAVELDTGAGLNRFASGGSGGSTKPLADVSRGFESIQTSGISGPYARKYQFGQPGDDHYVAAYINGSTISDITVRAMNPTLREQGITGRALTHSLMRRLEQDGIAIDTVNFSIASANMNGANTNWVVHSRLLAQGYSSREAMALTPSGKAFAEIGFDVGHVELKGEDLLIGSFVRRTGGGNSGGVGLISNGPGYLDELSLFNEFGAGGNARKLDELVKYGPTDNPTLNFVKKAGPGDGDGGLPPIFAGKPIKVQSSGTISLPDGTVVKDLDPMQRVKMSVPPGAGLMEEVERQIQKKVTKKFSVSRLPGPPESEPMVTNISMGRTPQMPGVLNHYIDVTPGPDPRVSGAQALHIDMATLDPSLNKRGMTGQAMLSTVMRSIRGGRPFDYGGEVLREGGYNYLNHPTVVFNYRWADPVYSKPGWTTPNYGQWFNNWGYRLVDENVRDYFTVARFERGAFRPRIVGR